MFSLYFWLGEEADDFPEFEDAEDCEAYFEHLEMSKLGW